MRMTRYKGPKLTVPSSVQGFSPEQLDNHWATRARVFFTVEDEQEAVRGEGMMIKWRPSRHIDYFAKARRRLFDHFGLDPNDPQHWRMLVDYFAYNEFWKGPRKKRGRPKEDKTERDAEIAAAIAALPSSLSNSELARQVKRKSKLPHGRMRTLRAHVARVKKSLPKAGR
jgi:hypothetical protein